MYKRQDTVPCFDLATLYTQLQATEQRGLLDLYDVLFIPARESIPRAPARLASWARAPAWVESRVEIKILRRLRPPRHRRDACSMAWRCRFLTARWSQHGCVIAEK